MYRLVLLRHGESEWNKKSLFTGWTDVDLSEEGIEEAHKAGTMLKEAGFQFHYAFTSYLKRAIKTLFYVLDEMDSLWIPVEKTWRLNEKHYGILQGMNKIDAKKKYGEKQVLMWRRSWDVLPDPITPDDPRHPSHDIRYKGIDCIPGTEALKDTTERILPYWNEKIVPVIKHEKEVLITAHGNSLRAIVKHIKNMDRETIINLNIPTGIPYLFEFDDNMNFVRDRFLIDEQAVKTLIDKAEKQGNTN